MKKTIFIIFAIMLIPATLGMTVYNTNNDITAQTGGTRFWSAQFTYGIPASNNTRITHNQGSGSAKVYRPGQTSSSTGTIGGNSSGYGWATNFTLEGDIPEGQWTFQATTKNNRNENNGRLGVNVFKYCSGTNTRLFYVQGAANVGGTTANLMQNITTNQGSFSMQGCSLKFEYWLNLTSVVEDNTNTINNVNTNLFFVTFPDSTGFTCQDTDSDGFTSAACGGTDCNDNDANIKPGAAETCNNIDDNCNAQADENLQNVTSCGIGACQATANQVCTSGQYLPACTPGQPTVEICNNSIDEDCDGVPDNNCPQANATCQDGENRTCGSNIGVCTIGLQICSGGAWGACSGAQPQAEVCNGLDDNCNNLTDEGLSATVTCGSGACARSVQQSCVGGQINGTCTPGQPASEVCNNADDNCNNATDENLVEACGSDIGECSPGTSRCAAGNWGSCQNEIKPMQEKCDLKDNDCDSFVDEENVCIVNMSPLCQENWQCSEWSTCIEQNTSARNCIDSNGCNTTAYRPSQLKSCIVSAGNESLASPAKLPLNETEAIGITILVVSVIFLGAGILISRQKKEAGEL